MSTSLAPVTGIAESLRTLLGRPEFNAESMPSSDQGERSDNQMPARGPRATVGIVQTSAAAGTSPDRAGRWSVSTGEQDPATVARLLGLLPAWFGIESSNAAYIESARRLPTYLARRAPFCAVPGPSERPRDGTEDPTVADPGEPVGVLLANRHFPQSAEIHFLAVDPRLHRRGVGRALVQALEADLVADGCELLQVKTLGPSHPDAGYTLTRKFYLGMGFLPVEELPGLWSPQNPCLIMIKVLGQS